MGKIEDVVTFKQRGGQNVWINPEHVELIEHSPEGGDLSIVTLASSRQVVLAHDPAEVARMLRGDAR